MLFDSHWELLMILLTVIMLYAVARWVLYNLSTTIQKTIISCTDWCIECMNRYWEANRITISWVPSHVGICGNERADQAAKEASMRPAEFIPGPYRDWFPLIKEKNYYLWNESWRTEERELRTLKVRPGKCKRATMKLNRSEEVVITGYVLDIHIWHMVISWTTTLLDNDQCASGVAQPCWLYIPKKI